MKITNTETFRPGSTNADCTRWPETIQFADALTIPNDKFLDLSKFKAFADDNLNVYQKLKFALGRVENIVGKGENAGYQHFLLFPQCFQKASFLGSLKVGIVL